MKKLIIAIILLFSFTFVYADDTNKDAKLTIENIQNSNDDTEYIEDYTIQKKYYTNFYENNHNYKKYKSSENIIDIEKYININKNLKLKIYKKAVEQSFNKLLKFCYTIIKDDISKFICELKKSSSSNNDNHKTYKRKNVINRNLIKTFKRSEKKKLEKFFHL